MSHTKRKARMSLSISRENAIYIKKLTVATRTSSKSAMIEKMIEEFKLREEAVKLNNRAIAYYDSLAAPAVEESSVWGALGEEGLAALEENHEIEVPDQLVEAHAH